VATDNHLFLTQDVGLHLGTKPLNTFTLPLHKIESTTSVSVTFTQQKNGVCNEVLSHGRSGHPLCCPTRAAIRLLLCHGQTVLHFPTKPIALCYNTRNKFTAVMTKDVTDKIKSAAMALRHSTGIHAKDLSACSLRACGATSLLCGNIDFDVIKMLGRWHSDSMI